MAIEKNYFVLEGVKKTENLQLILFVMSFNERKIELYICAIKMI